MKIFNTCCMMVLLGLLAITQAFWETGSIDYGAIRIKPDFAETVAHTFDYEFFNFFKEYPYQQLKNPDYLSALRPLPFSIKDSSLTITPISGDNLDFKFEYSALKQTKKDFVHVESNNLQVEAKFTIESTGEEVTVKGPIKNFNFNFPMQWDWDFKTDVITQWGDIQISGTEEVEKVKTALNLWIEMGVDSFFWYDLTAMERITKTLELSYTTYMPFSNAMVGNRYNDKYFEAGLTWPPPSFGDNQDKEPIGYENHDFGALQVVFTDKLFKQILDELKEAMEDDPTVVQPLSIMDLIKSAGFEEEAKEYMTCSTVREVIPTLCPKSMGDAKLDLVVIVEEKEVLSRLEDWEGPQYLVEFKENTFVVKAVFGLEIHVFKDGKKEVLRKITAPFKMKLELFKKEDSATTYAFSVRQVEFYDVTVFDPENEEMDNEKMLLQSTFNLALARGMMELDNIQFDIGNMLNGKYMSCFGYNAKNPVFKIVDHAIIFQYDYEPAKWDYQLCAVEFNEFMKDMDKKFEEFLEKTDEVDDIESLIEFASPYVSNWRNSPSPTEYGDMADKVRQDNKNVIEDL